MNIALFSDSYIPTKSGIVTVVVQLREQLIRLGHKVVLVTVETTPEYASDDPDIYQVKSVPLGMGTDQFFSFPDTLNVIHYLKEKQIDIIHCHTEFGIGKLGVRASKILHIPAVCTLHTMWVDFYKYYLPAANLIHPKVIDGIMDHFYKHFDALIGVSTKAKNYYGQPGIPSVVIPNSIDRDQFLSSQISAEEIQQFREKYNIKPDEVVLLFVGRIGEEKRVLELLQQCKKVVAECDKAKVIFVGKGPVYDYMVEQSKDEIEKGKIIYTGFVDWTQVHTFYQSCDIFITASLSEMHSMTILEAQLCGMPIVARNDESYQDSVIPGHNGFLSETDDQLGKDIIALVQDKEKRIEFGKQSKEITKNFTIEKNVSRTVALYQEVIKAYPKHIDEAKVTALLQSC